MHKYIFRPIRRRDEAETLCAVEKLYGAVDSHIESPLRCVQKPVKGSTLTQAAQVRLRALDR